MVSTRHWLGLETLAHVHSFRLDQGHFLDWRLYIGWWCTRPADKDEEFD